MLKNIYPLLASTLLLIFFSCKKGNEYPIEPAITFKSLTTDKDGSGKDVTGHLTISFTDGDGDIGLSSSDTAPPYNVGSPFYYNMVIVYYEKNSNGQWVVININPPHSGRIPVLTPEGKNKSLRGDIIQDIFLHPGVTNLSTKYDVFIYDRALHKSNTVTSTELVISTN